MLPPEAVATPWYRWAPVGLSAVAVVVALALTGVTLLAEHDNGALSNQVGIRPYSGSRTVSADVATESSLRRVQDHLAELEASVRDGEPVAPSFLADLEEANEDLAAELDGADSIALLDQAAAVSAASRQYQLLNELLAQTPPEDAEPVAESLASAAGVLQRLGAPTPAPTHPPASPQPTVSPAATTSPQPSPAPSQTAPPSLTPTPAP
jgi:hypothetical protein